MLTRAHILALVPRHADPDVLAEKLSSALKKAGITDRTEIAVLLGQLAHESGLVPQTERLFYTAPRMMAVWPSRFPTLASALPYAGNPEALANKVYARKDLGNVHPGDGWRYRGRGLIQTTGRHNYTACGKRIGFDLAANPDLLLQWGVSCLAAVDYWTQRGCGPAARRGDIRTVTRMINGGYTGLSDREVLYRRVLNSLPQPRGLLGSFGPDTDVQAAPSEADLMRAELTILAERDELFRRALAALQP